MKLLFDQNLSPKLVNRLADLFPEARRKWSGYKPETAPRRRWKQFFGLDSLTLRRSRKMLPQVPLF